MKLLGKPDPVFAGLGVAAAVSVGYFTVTSEITTAGFLSGVIQTLILLFLALPRERRLKTVLRAAFICVFVVEGMFFVAQVTPLILDIKVTPVNHDSRAPGEVLAELRAKGVDAVPLIYPDSIVANDDLFSDIDPGILPLGGIANATTVHCSETGPFIIYRSDRHGFRNPDGVWDEPIDAMIVGDSFAHGACVENDVATVMRDTFGKGVITLGMSGNETLLALASVREYALKRAAPFVFFMFYDGNDLSPGRPHPIRDAYLLPGFSQNLSRQQPRIDAALDRYWKEKGEIIRERKRGRTDDAHCVDLANRVCVFGFRHFSAQEVLRQSFAAVLLPRMKSLVNTAFGRADAAVRPLVNPAYMPVISAALARMDADLKAVGTQLVFVYLPGHQSLAFAPKNNLNHRELIRITNELDIPVIDFYASIHAADAPWSYYAHGSAGGHLNEFGYRELAATFNRFMHGAH